MLRRCIPCIRGRQGHPSPLTRHMSPPPPDGLGRAGESHRLKPATTARSAGRNAGRATWWGLVLFSTKLGTIHEHHREGSLEESLIDALDICANGGRDRVAVIGAGVAGLTAAYLLQRRFEVTLIESDVRLGGHAHTHDVVSSSGSVMPVDTGFIVHNKVTYPNLVRLFRQLNVVTRPTDMSMSVSCDGCGLEYVGARGLGGLFAQKRSLGRAQFIRCWSGSVFPGWVTPGFYIVDVVPTGTSPLHPLLLARLYLGWGDNKTVAAYVTSSPTGTAGHPTLGVFTNDVRATHGQARVTVRHLAVAPTVAIYADGMVPITTAFSNGQTARAVVPAGSYNVTVTAPNAPTTVLANLGNVTLSANTNTLAFAIGAYPSTFKVVTLVVPTR